MESVLRNGDLKNGREIGEGDSSPFAVGAEALELVIVDSQGGIKLGRLYRNSSALICERDISKIVPMNFYSTAYLFHVD